MSGKTLRQLYAEHTGKVSDKWSLYLTEYDRLLADYRDRPVRLLEIGIQNGGSLEIWAKYFHNASVLIGCDVNPDCGGLKYDDSRVDVIVGDANAPGTRARVFECSPQFDIVIDDGSHLSSDIIKSFANYFPGVAEGGLFVVEDLHCSYWSQYEGGLFYPYSSISFFKRLADVVSHEHWGVPRPRTDVLRGIFTKYNFEVDAGTLSQVHSVEFINSMCVVRKAAAANNKVGRRVVAGSTEPVVQSLRGRHDSEYLLDPGLGQSGNPWTTRTAPPEEELVQAELALADAVRRNAALGQRSDELSREIGRLRSSRSWRLTAPLRFLVAQLKALAAVVRGDREPPTNEGMLGSLDTPRSRSRVEQNALAVKGWLFSKDTPIDALTVTIDGLPEVLVTHGYSRADVALANPGFANAERSGFEGRVPLAGTRPGKVALVIWATVQDGRRLKCFERRILVRSVFAQRTFSPLLFDFLQSSATRAWRALRDGRLPLSPLTWLLRLRRDYRMMLRTQQIMLSQRARPRTAKPHDPYQQWMATNRPTAKVLSRMKADASRLMASGPRISVVVPVYNTPRAFLEEMISSVVAQIYSKWEMCLVDDASTQPHVRETLERMASNDHRIRVISRNQNGHIVEATNSGLDVASGEYVAFLDHDDLLSPDALLHIAECISRNPGVDWIYTDEDKIDRNGLRYDPQFKGEWNPEMAITHNFVHHLTVIRKHLVDRVGGMRKGFEGAQDLDLFLRVSENTSPDRIKHIPHICYHWRSHAGSTASRGTQKDYVFHSAHRAISEALKRRALQAEPFLPALVERHGMCLYQLRWGVGNAATQMVTIVIPTKDRVDLLERCVTSLQKTVSDQVVKLLIVDDRSSDSRTLAYFDRLERERVFHCRVVHPKADDGAFNYARLMNHAAAHVDTPYVLLLNNDIEAIQPGWLEDMLGWMSVGGVGAVGARLVYPNGDIQHAGVVVGPHGGLADHQFHRLPQDEVGYLALPHAARNVTAVTGACLLTSIDLYRELGGFDEHKFAVAYNDVDFCLRVIASGKRIVYTPQATLVHLTSASRGTDYNPDEHINFVQKYSAYRDPFFNENIQIESMQMAVDPDHFAHADRAGKLRVLLVSHSLALGGAPIAAYEVARQFTTCGGFEVRVFSPSDGPMRERYEELGIAVEVLSDFPTLQGASVDEVRAYLKDLGDRVGLATYDLVVCNTLVGFWGVEMARMFGIPSVWHIHESTPIEDAGAAFALQPMLPLLYSCFMNANRVVFQAEATRRLFDGASVRDNFWTIPGGVPLERINAFRATHGKKQTRDKYGIAENCTVVTIVGTTCERKGQHVFLRAVKELEGHYPDGLPDDLVFIIVGAAKGAYLDFLHKRRNQLGLGKVRIFDETKDIYDFYLLSDVFVCASFEESFPMVVLLAMAFELKVVSTDVFGIPEIISDAHEGRLVKPGNPAAMGEAIYECLNDPELSSRMARRAYAKVCRLFDNGMLLDRHLALAKKVALEEPAGENTVKAPSGHARAHGARADLAL